MLETIKKVIKTKQKWVKQPFTTHQQPGILILAQIPSGDVILLVQVWRYSVQICKLCGCNKAIEKLGYKTETLAFYEYEINLP
jgi:hypothetical protein